MGEELQVVGLGVHRHQAVADADLVALVVQQQGGGLDAADLAAGHGARAHAHHLVAEHFLALVGRDHVGPELAAVHDPAAAEVQVLGAEQVAAQARALQVVVAHGRAQHGEAVAGVGGQVAHVGHLALDRAHPVLFQPDHVRQVLEAVDYAQVLEEGLDVRQRDRVDRRRLLARPGLHAGLGHAVQIGQADDVAGIDQVRVLDLRVRLPDLGPQPRSLEEASGDVPEGVAADHHIGVGMVAPDSLGGSERRDGEQRNGKDRA